MDSIESEFDRVGESLKNLGTLLKQSLRSASGEALAADLLDTSIGALPTQQTFSELLADLRAQRQKDEDHSKCTAELGVSC